jgi:predicted amidohydrolase
MARIVTVAAAQLGPIQREDSRASCVDRMIDLLYQSAAAGCDVVVYPELALTTKPTTGMKLRCLTMTLNLCLTKLNG